MDNALKVYWDALDRLKRGKPNIVKPGGRITNDQVSLEAGRGRGSIKKSRPIFSALIAAIKEANEKGIKLSGGKKEKYSRKCHEANKYRALYEESIAREVSMLRQIYELQQELDKLHNPNIYPLTTK